MASVKREKIALIGFVTLLVVGLVAICTYLFVGHSWNFLATTVDDISGSMNGYAVITFQGTVPPNTTSQKEVDIDKTASDASKDVDSMATTSHNESILGKEQSSEEQSKVDKIASFAQSLVTKDDAEPPTPDSVAETYEKAGATVITLDSLDLDEYKNGVIRVKNNWKIGLLTVTADETQVAVQRKVNGLNAGADFVVVLTDHLTNISAVKGIDAVINASDGTLKYTGKLKSNAFVMDAPEEGQVGVMIVSPVYMVSTKVIK